MMSRAKLRSGWDAWVFSLRQSTYVLHLACRSVFLLYFLLSVFRCIKFSQVVGGFYVTQRMLTMFKVGEPGAKE